MTDRWDRLAEKLAEAGIDAKPIREFGRNGNRVYISIRTETGRVEIHDRWWRKNLDVWIGWNVYLDDREGYVKRDFPLTKKYSEVVANVTALLAVTV